MRRTITFVAAFVWMIASARAQETVCALFKNLGAADGRQLILDGELILTEDLAVLAAADCDNKYDTPIDHNVVKGWPTGVHLRPSPALSANQLQEFQAMQAKAVRLRAAGKTVSAIASLAGRLRVAVANDFPAELVFDSIQKLELQELVDPEAVPVISICDLFQDLESWRGKRIAVRGETLSAPTARAWMVGRCLGKFYTNAYRWPVALTITNPAYYAPSVDTLASPKYALTPPKGEERLRHTRNVTRTATYVGLLRMRSNYAVSCRDDGRYVSNGFNHGAPAEIILEAITDVELTSRQAVGSDLVDQNDCEPSNHDSLCAEAKTLIRAVTVNCPHRVAELLSQQGIDSKNGGESTAMASAIRLGREPILRQLLAAGAPVNPVSFTLGLPLADAASARRIEMMKILLKAGANVDGLDTRGATYLASYGFFDTGVERILLDAGANPNARDDEGITALMWASRFGYAESARLLVAHGADVNLKDNNGKSALMHAAAGLYIDAIPTLLNNGADLYARDLEGKTALDIAKAAENHFTEQLLNIAISSGN